MNKSAFITNSADDDDLDEEKLEKMPIKSNDLINSITRSLKEVKDKVPKITNKLPWEKSRFFIKRQSK